MKAVKYISSSFVGILFIFSGAVKAIDPLGTVYKLQDYFSAFDVAFLKDFALLFTILLCTAEFLSGISILFNLRHKTGIWLALIMMAAFTPLTFVLALTNPVSDCGCFGDAIKLTNWQTFWKNIIILVPTIYLFLIRNRNNLNKNVLREWYIISAFCALFIIFIFFNLRYLPVIDFLPYKKGANIPSQMLTPADSPPDRYETSFIYEKDGVKKEFSLSDYPADDTTWIFIDQKTVLVEKGYQPPIYDFAIISSRSNEDLTDMILSHQGYTLIMISKKLEEANEKALEKGFGTGRYFEENGINFFVLTATGSDEIGKMDNTLHFCLGDETTLKTIVRSNPGYILLKEGTIIEKWSWAELPGIESLEKEINKLYF